MRVRPLCDAIEISLEVRLSPPQRKPALPRLDHTLLNLGVGGSASRSRRSLTAPQLWCGQHVPPAVVAPGYPGQFVVTQRGGIALHGMLRASKSPSSLRRTRLSSHQAARWSPAVHCVRPASRIPSFPFALRGTGLSAPRQKVAPARWITRRSSTTSPLVLPRR